ncbi:hypothetical protein O2K51_04040 [Apibacter raozihei]|uniref:hypothetical protein n=1 Tax=Apibacter raozihei TaxID=2500547 RepID=UPI000FE2F9BD|nr:hypothetical protein [Apibacter raozihei]
MSTHPQIITKSGGYSSSAAGAYQIMGYTYKWLGGQDLDKNFKPTGVYDKNHDYIKKYSIPNFNQESQDKLCIIILRHKRSANFLDLITKNKIQEALEEYGSYEWASLPPSRYGQPNQTMENALSNYNKFLKLELAGETDLHLKKGFLKDFGYTCDTCSIKSNISSICKLCNKRHVDLSNKVVWQTQFNAKWGDKKAQNSACKKTCDAILVSFGLKETSKNKLYQTALENKTHTKLEIKTDQAKLGVSYLDSQLEKGNPVQVGVDHDLNYRGGINEGTTDHFIVIIGRGCENGKIYYHFYDVGTSYKAKGSSQNNKLYLDISDYSLKGKTVYNGNFYTVTQIRINQ